MQPKDEQNDYLHASYQEAAQEEVVFGMPNIKEDRLFCISSWYWNSLVGGVNFKLGDLLKSNSKGKQNIAT